MAQSLDSSEEKKTKTQTGAWDEFLELAKNWPRIKIGSGDAATTVPFSAAHLYKNSPMWRKAMEGDGGSSESPPALLTQNRIDPATDLEFQRVWMYLNGFIAGVPPEDLSKTGEQYLGYFGGNMKPLPKSIRDVLHELNQMFKEREELVSDQDAALDLMKKYKAAIRKNDSCDGVFTCEARSKAVKRILERSNFNVDDDSDDESRNWQIEYNPPKRARKM